MYIGIPNSRLNREESIKGDAIYLKVRGVVFNTLSVLENLGALQGIAWSQEP